MITAVEAKQLSENIDMGEIEEFVLSAARGGLTSVNILEKHFTQPRVQLLEKLGYKLFMTANGYTVNWENAKADD